MNTYGYMKFAHEEALKDWELGFVKYLKYDEENSTFDVEVVILDDKKEYDLVTKKDGTTFMPKDNNLEKFTVKLTDKPADLKKLQPIKILDALDNYLMGASTYNPKLVLFADKIVAK